jgi:putative peptide maturation system protein
VARALWGGLLPDFARALGDAVELLRQLPRTRGAVPEARRRAGAFGQDHPELQSTLVVDRPPATHDVEYDLLFQHPAGGTVALTYREDRGVPWAVDYSDHWAANYVVSVDGEHLSVQQALLLMRFTGWRSDDLMTDLVDWAIIHRELDLRSWETTEAELQECADNFRAARGLFTAEAMEAWMRSVGLDAREFARMVAGAVETRRLAEEVTGGHAAIESFYAAAPDRADRLSYLEVRRADAEPGGAGELAGGGRLWERTMAGLRRGDAMEGVLRQRFAFTLPPALASAPAGRIVQGGSGRDAWVAEVLSRVPSQLDAATRRTIRDHLFHQWLERRRAEAKIEWHWVEPPLSTLD